MTGTPAICLDHYRLSELVINGHPAWVECQFPGGGEVEDALWITRTVKGWGVRPECQRDMVKSWICLSDDSCLYPNMSKHIWQWNPGMKETHGNLCFIPAMPGTTFGPNRKQTLGRAGP